MSTTIENQANTARPERTERQKVADSITSAVIYNLRNGLPIETNHLLEFGRQSASDFELTDVWPAVEEATKDEPAEQKTLLDALKQEAEELVNADSKPATQETVSGS